MAVSNVQRNTGIEDARKILTERHQIERLNAKAPGERAERLGSGRSIRPRNGRRARNPPRNDHRSLTKEFRCRIRRRKSIQCELMLRRNRRKRVEAGVRRRSDSQQRALREDSRKIQIRLRRIGYRIRVLVLNRREGLSRLNDEVGNCQRDLRRKHSGRCLIQRRRADRIDREVILRSECLRDPAKSIAVLHLIGHRSASLPRSRELEAHCKHARNIVRLDDSGDAAIHCRGQVLCSLGTGGRIAPRLRSRHVDALCERSRLIICSDLCRGHAVTKLRRRLHDAL